MNVCFPLCKKIAPRVGQTAVDKGALPCQNLKVAFSFDGFTKVFRKAQTAVSTTTHLNSLTHRTIYSVHIQIFTHFSVSICKNGCPLHPMFLTPKWKEGIHFLAAK